MSSAYDQVLAELGLEDTESVDPTEVKQIAKLLKEIQVRAAQVAKDNDTSNTLQILQAVKAGMDFLLGMTPQQARAYNHAISIGADAIHPSIAVNGNNGGHQPLALGGAAPAQTPVTNANPLVASFAQAVGRGDQLTILAIGYLLDPNNRDWQIVDDGNGQPVLRAIKALNAELDDLRTRFSKVTNLLTGEQGILKRASRLVGSIRKVQAAIERGSDDRWYDLRPDLDPAVADQAPTGPDAASLTGFEGQVNNLANELRPRRTHA